MKNQENLHLANTEMTQLLKLLTKTLKQLYKSASKVMVNTLETNGKMDSEINKRYKERPNGKIYNYKLY